MALTNTSFADSLLFSRPNEAEYKDFVGITQTAGIDEPRIDYFSNGYPGLLLDSALAERAALKPLAHYNEYAGAWIINATLEKCYCFPRLWVGPSVHRNGNDHYRL